MAAFSERPLAIGEGEAAREYRVGTLSASFFDFFDRQPALGRFFRADEDVTPSGADVVVLSHAFWDRVGLGGIGRAICGRGSTSARSDYRSDRH